jgi:hypothetical protein
LIPFARVAAFSSIELPGPHRVAIRAAGKPGVQLSGERNKARPAGGEADRWAGKLP